MNFFNLDAISNKAALIASKNAENKSLQRALSLHKSLRKELSALKSAENLEDLAQEVQSKTAEAQLADEEYRAEVAKMQAAKKAK